MARKKKALVKTESACPSGGRLADQAVSSSTAVEPAEEILVAEPESTVETVDQKQARLDLLENTIRAGLTTFIDVGQALLEIRDNKLYFLRNYGSFEAYCHHHLGISRQHGYRLMDAAEVIKNLSPAGDNMSPIGDMPLPTNEAQTRELT